jgi:hypothetical protein
MPMRNMKPGYAVLSLLLGCGVAFAAAPYYYPSEAADPELPIDAPYYGGMGATGEYYPIREQLADTSAANGQLGERPRDRAPLYQTLQDMNPSPTGTVYRRATVYARGYLPRYYRGAANTGRTDDVPREASIYYSGADGSATLYGRGWLERHDSFGLFPDWGVQRVYTYNEGAPVGYGVKRPFGLGSPVGFEVDPFYASRSPVAFSPNTYQIGSSDYGKAGLRTFQTGFRPQRSSAGLPLSHFQQRVSRQRIAPKSYEGGPYSGRLGN